jgi:hypothetical protein
LVDLLYDFTVQYEQYFTKDELERRKANGQVTLYYTSCATTYPNSYTFSSPAEATCMALHAVQAGFDGFLRWAYNSWAENPQYDSRFGGWMSGDTYFVYPYNRSSIRFERLIDGIEVSEKVRALRAAGADMSAVDAVLEKVRTVEITDYKQPWQEIMTEARKALDEAARK